ncbi:kinesin KIN-14I [Olea europaea subsp. europaea]|uniref:Kinesin KIN-14I n=1 Tax=Olea europaea subsp. europaea TaxID=158383 RepID=A0A8S0UGZ8_OLEEU|nr:kinesin KIN-14I [Olea europaea subsp. europaea]
MVDGVLQFNVESVVEDVLQQQGKRLSGIDFASRKAEEAWGKNFQNFELHTALKSYNEWKQGGGNVVWKFSGNSKSSSTRKSFVRKNSELFMSSISRNSSSADKSLDSLSGEHDTVHDFIETGLIPCTHLSVNSFLIRAEKIFMG